MTPNRLANILPKIMAAVVPGAFFSPFGGE